MSTLCCKFLDWGHYHESLCCQLVVKVGKLSQTEHSFGEKAKKNELEVGSAWKRKMRLRLGWAEVDRLAAARSRLTSLTALPLFPPKLTFSGVSSSTYILIIKIVTFGQLSSFII